MATSLEEACTKSLALVMENVEKDQRSDADQMVLFVHFKLLLQLCAITKTPLQIHVQQYCSTCSDTEKNLDANVQLPCGDYTCSGSCFRAKYGQKPSEGRLCVICGAVISKEFYFSVLKDIA